MGCYQYYNIFQEFGRKIRSILLDSPDRPYPLYETRADFDADTVHTYKGILVWESYRYYKDAEDDNQNTQFYTDVGYYVVPEFGEVTVVPNYEYRQLLVVTVDSNSEPDFDPFQKKAITFIDWFMQKIRDEVELNKGFVLSSGAKMYVHITGVSRPIITRSVYVRRAVTLIARLCSCL